MAIEIPRTLGELLQGAPAPWHVRRLQALGLNTELKAEGGDEPLFSTDTGGNILIRYPSLEGGYQSYLRGQAQHPYIVRALEDPLPGRPAYYTPKGVLGRVFYPPSVVASYRAGTQLDTLLLTEWPFSAMAADAAGIPAVGMSGLRGYRAALRVGDTLRLADDLSQLLEVCRPRNVIVLAGAGARRVSWADGVDLAQPLFDMYMLTKQLRDALKQIGLEGMTYLELSPRKDSYPADLEQAIALGATADSLREDLDQVLNAPDPYSFNGTTIWGGRRLDGADARELKELFYVANVDSFYRVFAQEIGERKFVWLRAQYRIDEAGRVEKVRHEDAAKYIRVACNYFKLIQRPTSKGDAIRHMQPWMAGEITRDYGKQFFDFVTKYDSFCNVPDNTTDYKQVVVADDGSTSYNLYYPVQVDPIPGDYPTIRMFIQHAFGTAEVEVESKGMKTKIPRWIMGMDYIQIIYQKPLERLPILCLVNKQRNTGKSTFLEFMRMMLGDNATIVGNEDLEDGFNSSFVSKLVIGVDEGFIDKKKVIEKLKHMATTKTMKLHSKGKDKSEIDFFGKFILTSNDESNFVNVDEEEIRFWVLKVPQFTKENPDLVDDMAAELPAFLHHLNERKIVCDRKTRMWFAPEWLRTAELEKLFLDSRSWLHKELASVLEEKFSDHPHEELYFTLQHLIEMVNKHTSRKWTRQEVEKLLKEKIGIKPERGRRPVYALQRVGNTGLMSEIADTEQGRFYTFVAKDWLTPEDYANIKNL